MCIRDSSKKNLGKQLDLANKRNLNVAIICGENEFKDNTITIKNLKGVKGQNSQTVPKADLIHAYLLRLIAYLNFSSYLKKFLH